MGQLTTERYQNINKNADTPLRFKHRSFSTSGFVSVLIVFDGSMIGSGAGFGSDFLTLGCSTIGSGTFSGSLALEGSAAGVGITS